MDKILENRLFVDEEIEAYEEVLDILRKEKESLVKTCEHRIRIINKEENGEFYGVFTVKEFCLICGKEFYRTRVMFPLNTNNVIQMVKYPLLNKKWGKNYRKEVEKICLSIKKSNPECSENEICIMLKEKLEELEVLEEEDA